MARKRKNDSAHIELADALENWAKKNQVFKSPYVTELTTALREKSELHKWAELDAFELLPIPTPRLTENVLRRIDLITNIRNVLVFAPVGLTWAAVGEATRGFEAYVKQNGASVVNFLEFWQNGFGVLPSFWRIGDVARLDFLIIAGVIALTVAISVLTRRANKNELHETTKIDNDRILLATQLTLFLMDKKKLTNLTFNQSMSGAIQRLQNATTALEKTAKELQKSTKKFPKIDQ